MSTSLSPIPPATWTEGDWIGGLCTARQVGTEKSSAPSTLDDVIRDAERVYERRGNVLYLKQHQKFLRNVLLTGLKPSTPPAPVVRLRVAWQ